VIVGAVRDPGAVITAPDLTETERHMIDAAMAGEPVTCTDTGHCVRAEVVRDLLVGRHGEVDPRGGPSPARRRDAACSTAAERA
jgi:hypothetical protein